MRENSKQVAITGCGQVKAAEAYSLMMSGALERLLLVGEGGDRLRGEIMDLQRVIPPARTVRIDTGGCEDAAEAAIVIIASAAEPAAYQTPGEALANNAAIIRRICEKLNLAGFDGIILVTTNPADILAQVALEASGLPPNRVIGSGISWAAEQFRAAEDGRIKNGWLDRPEAATWCAALEGNPPLVDYCQPNCPDFDRMLEALDRSPARGEPKRGCAYCPAGTCVNRICEAVLRDDRTVLPVYVLAGGQYGVSGVFLNLPCVIGRDGVEQIIELPLSGEERQGLTETAEFLEKTLEQIKDAGRNSAAARIF